MTIDTDDLMEIKERLNEQQSERDKLLGKKEGLIEQLKKLGYANIKDAQKGLSVMEDEIKEEETRLAEDVLLFKEKYGELL